VHDPLAALVFCRVGNVDLAIVNGESVIEAGAFVRLDVERLVAAHNDHARALIR
jgi:hypothetical protein